jgi:hypothetical protein
MMPGLTFRFKGTEYVGLIITKKNVGLIITKKNGLVTGKLHKA